MINKDRLLNKAKLYYKLHHKIATCQFCKNRVIFTGMGGGEKCKYSYLGADYNLTTENGILLFFLNRPPWDYSRAFVCDRFFKKNEKDK